MARKFLNGNAATAYAVKLSRAEVVAAYPITPQTKIVEKVAELIAENISSRDRWGARHISEA